MCVCGGGGGGGGDTGEVEKGLKVMSGGQIFQLFSKSHGECMYDIELTESCVVNWGGIWGLPLTEREVKVLDSFLFRYFHSLSVQTHFELVFFPLC